MKKNSIFFIIIAIYIISLIFGIILSDLNFIDVIKNINTEKILFLLYNLYIILFIILFGFNKIESNTIRYRFYIATILGHIIFQIIYFIWETYKILVMYNFDRDASMLIGSILIKPNGLLLNVVIPLILLQLNNIKSNHKP